MKRSRVRRRVNKWVVLTVKEPLGIEFPTAPPGQGKGPFTAPYSKWYRTLEEKEYAERQAAYYMALGYTVTVSEEVRR